MVETREWRWRPIDARDAMDVHKLITAVEEADNAPIRTTRAEVTSYFQPTHVWRAEAAMNADEQMIAFVLVRTPVQPARRGRITISGGVHPAWRHRGVGREALDRQLALARQVADAVAADDPHVTVYVESQQESLMTLVLERDFIHESTSIQMRRLLADTPDSQAQGSYVHVESYGEAWMDATLRAHNLIVADRIGWSELSDEEWEARISHMHAPWCLVAVDTFGDRPRLAGYLLASGFATNHGSLDETLDEGYIEEVVVLPEFRGNHVAAQLFAEATERFRNDGISYIGLDVSLGPHEEIDQSFVPTFTDLGFVPIAHTYILGRPL